MLARTTLWQDSTVALWAHFRHTRYMSAPPTLNELHCQARHTSSSTASRFCIVAQCAQAAHASGRSDGFCHRYMQTNPSTD